MFINIEGVHIVERRANGCLSRSGLNIDLYLYTTGKLYLEEGWGRDMMSHRCTYRYAYLFF